ncbi:MAG: amino acid-binding protein [Candidatus Methanomethylophilaceae archaeon]|nr:amino acid-binding protein [Candidatus Methanomethylophilaceae archaeon]
MADSIIEQLSIFVNNEPGRLAYVASVLKECGINMHAFNLAESTDFGILRAIVDDPEEAYRKLKEKGIIVKKTEVIAVSIEDTPGALFAAADAFGKAGINIEYGYAYSGKKASVFYMRVNDPQKAVDLLKSKGISLVTSGEI